MLGSSCLEGKITIDSSRDDSPLRIKIVDSESSDPEEKQEAQKYQTGDCHGKISPKLARALGGKGNRPFQFRLAWKKEWGIVGENNPSTSFLAKGTFLPSKRLTEDNGYDIILDRSSIKGIAKDKLAELIPCGDYSMPKAILGNRGNAKNQNYANSWQLLGWYSKDAIAKDILPETIKEAKKLASLQQDPVKLASYLIEQYDKRKEIGQNNIENSGDNENNDENEKSSKMIEILRADKYGQLLDHPGVANFMQRQLQERWKDLAIKGAVEHGSAMAQPCDDLKPGTIVASNLEQGEKVIVTRYPIVSSDNIRCYTVDNEQKPELKSYKGCVFIRPDEAMKNHQCDFDGDQLVVTPAKLLPNIAAETKHANDNPSFAPVEKRKKVDYIDVVDDKGNKRFNGLSSIAMVIQKNQIGQVATAIGRVVSSSPKEGEDPVYFQKKQGKLLNKLFDALQIEVDSPKSATRSKDVYPYLKKEIKDWTKEYPSPVFDFKNDDALYLDGKLPIIAKSSLTVLADEGVNQVWENSKLPARTSSNFRYLFSPPSQQKDRYEWNNKYIPWAQKMANALRTAGKEIKAENTDDYGNSDTKAIKEQFGQLYANARDQIEEIFPTSSEKQLAAAALWHVETSNENLDKHRNICSDLSTKMNQTFNFIERYERTHSIIGEDTWVISVPFNKEEDKNGKKVKVDRAGAVKNWLDQKGIKYEAQINNKLPMVDFALVEPSEKLINNLSKQFSNNNNNNHINETHLVYTNNRGEEKPLKIEPPQDLTWAKTNNLRKAALTFNLFTEQVEDALSQEIEKIEVLGQKYNDFKGVDFNGPDWNQIVEITVGINDSDDPRYNGQKILKIDNKKLGMMNKETAQFPVGTKFEANIKPVLGKQALELNIVPGSIQLDTENQEKTAIVDNNQPIEKVTIDGKEYLQFNIVPGLIEAENKSTIVDNSNQSKNQSFQDNSTKVNSDVSQAETPQKKANPVQLNNNNQLVKSKEKQVEKENKSTIVDNSNQSKNQSFQDNSTKVNSDVSQAEIPQKKANSVQLNNNNKPVKKQKNKPVSPIEKVTINGQKYIQFKNIGIKLSANNLSKKSSLKNEKKSSFEFEKVNKNGKQAIKLKNSNFFLLGKKKEKSQNKKPILHKNQRNSIKNKTQIEM